MSIINIRGDSNELNAILNSPSSNVQDDIDVSGNIIGSATVDLPDLPLVNKYIFDISGDNHDVTTIHNSAESVLNDGNVQSNNNTITGITII